MILYVDASAGVSGDMLLSAFLRMGLPVSRVHQAFQDFGFKALVQTSLERCEGVGATRIKRWEVRPPLRWRCRQDFIDFVRERKGDPFLRESLLRVMNRLAIAEAQAHHQHQSRVALHQVGAADTLVNIVGFCVGLGHFQVKKVYVSSIPVGILHQDPLGVWRKAPGPATLRLLKGFPIRLFREPFEWTTPTGAALLSTFASLGSPPPFRVHRIGFGMGQRRHPSGPRVLRLLLGQRSCVSLDTDSLLI